MENNEEHVHSEHGGWAHPGEDGECDHTVVDWNELLAPAQVKQGIVLVLGDDGYMRMHSVGIDTLHQGVHMLTQTARQLIEKDMAASIVGEAEEIIKGMRS